LKGRIKSVLGRTDDKDTARPETSGKHDVAISQDTGEGNLRDDSDVAWYLKFDDNDGWESTDANAKNDGDVDDK
jgi:hypothetical protein